MPLNSVSKLTIEFFLKPPKTAGRKVVDLVPPTFTVKTVVWVFPGFPLLGLVWVGVGFQSVQPVPSPSPLFPQISGCRKNSQIIKLSSCTGDS